jgi:hypothetical protein
MSQWHSRLGHPSVSIVKQVVSKNNLPCLDESSNRTVCDACQQGKSHQLPYPNSSSNSEFPLQLIFSDVWVLLRSQLEERSFMLALLMILVNLLGSIC